MNLQIFKFNSSNVQKLEILRGTHQIERYISQQKLGLQAQQLGEAISKQKTRTSRLLMYKIGGGKILVSKKLATSTSPFEKLQNHTYTLTLSFP